MEYFIKDGARYRSIGFSVPEYLEEGLWIVQRTKGLTKTESFTHKLSNLPQKIEVENYLKLFLNRDNLTQALSDLGISEFDGNYQSTAEKILNQIINNNLKQFQCATKKS